MDFPFEFLDPSLLRRAGEAEDLFRVGTPDMEEVLRTLLADGPRSGWELARAVEAAAPGALAGREGYLYPLLAAMERVGGVEARWVEGGDGHPYRLYSLPGRPGEERGAAPGPDRLPHPVLQEAARDATRTIPGAFERESARAEILGHLERSAGAYARLGLDSGEAARNAVRDLGDSWKIRTDLGRVHRGKPVVVFPRTLAERVRSLAIYDLAPLALALGLVLLVRWQVVQAYNIPTSSMEPTLHGDDVDPDFILVDKTAFLRRDPRRWDIIVFYPPPAATQERTAFVKRCVGLGGESLDIRGGDLFVDGVLARRPAEVEDAMMVPIYDLGLDLVQAARRYPRGELPRGILDTAGAAWRRRSGSWALAGDRLRGDPSPDGEARLAYGRTVDNSYIDLDGRTARFYDEVGDVEVRFVAVPGGEGSSVGADLLEGEARHSLRVGPDGVEMRSGELAWRNRTVRARPGIPVELRFRNVDDRLTAWVDGEIVLREELPPRGAVPLETREAGVEIVAAGGPSSFGGVALRRDIQYERANPPGERDSWPRRVPEGSVFMMGDNTGRSNDSRMWGPVPEHDLIGVPFVVLYPLSRFKPLR